MHALDEFLARSAKNHRHLCPRQVLGVRMGLVAGKLLGLDVPRDDKKLLTIVETDGCVVDGIAAVTHCSVGQRTLRVEDYGKVAATFIDTASGRAMRLVPRRGVRQTAAHFAPNEKSKWRAQLIGYQRMPDEELLLAQGVELIQSLDKIISRPGKNSLCQSCGEEVLNERELIQGESTLCKPCGAGSGYYRIFKYRDESGLPSID